jgi:hypothetical protein
MPDCSAICQFAASAINGISGKPVFGHLDGSKNKDDADQATDVVREQFLK